MKKYITIFFLLSVLMFSFNMVSAVPPFLTSAEGSTVGLQIFYPQIEAVEYNKNFTFEIHISNLSNGVQFENSEVDCYVYLYNSVGEPILESDAIGDGTSEFDLKIKILSGNFTEYGKRNRFYIRCNASENLEGEMSGFYDITGNGKILPGGVVVLGFVLMMMIIFMGITFFLIRAVGLIIDASFDILDVAYAWGLYFGLLGLNQLSIIYLGTLEVMNWLDLFVTILAFPLVIIPIIAFFLSLFRENKTKRAERQAW